MALLETPVGSDEAAPPKADPWWTRFSRDIGVGWGPLIVIVLCVYVALNVLTASGAHLLTDVGGKAASLEAMQQRGDWNPDIGYWYADVDPTGRFFPLDKTTQTANGGWVNTTSLTMVLMMKPLYDLGGPTLAVLIPILGALGAALSAGALERRLSVGASGKWSFLLVGLSSSVIVYSTDLWEHTLALAAIGFASVKTIDAIQGRAPIVSALLAGLGYGFAATMRQEALVYGFVAGLVLVALVTRRSGIARSIASGLAMILSLIHI